MDKDAGTIEALMIRFREYRLPRAKRMLARDKQGETLTDPDIDFLKRVFEDAQTIMPLVEKHPEYHQLASKAYAMYSEIIEKATENEKSRKD